MAFAAGAHVFPGGRVDPDDADPALTARSVLGAATPPRRWAATCPRESPSRRMWPPSASCSRRPASFSPTRRRRRRGFGEARSALLRGDVTFPDLAVDLDLTLRTDLLVPLSRWVTPVTSPRRFDTRFFAAVLPEGVEPSFEGGEVAGHAWLRPTDALTAMAAGRLMLWLPTSTTLQQLEHVASPRRDPRAAVAGPLGEVAVEPSTDAVTRIVMPAGGGVAGQPVNAYLVGRRRFVLVDPGDPTGPALDRAITLAAERGGRSRPSP